MKKVLISLLIALPMLSGSTISNSASIDTYDRVRVLRENNNTSEVSTLTDSTTPISESTDSTPISGTTSTSVVSSDIVSNSVTTSEDVGSTSKDFEDLDENGIPDFIDKYYDEHIKDQYMFGISLGSIIGVAVSVLGLAFTWLKNNKFGNELINQTKENGKKVLELIAENQRYKELIKSLTEQNEEALNGYKAMIEDIFERIGSYGEITDLINALIKLVLETNPNVNAEAVSKILSEINYDSKK